jgi:hypothetical protein
MTKTTIAVCHSRTITSRAVEYCVEHSADAAPGTPHIRRIDRLPRCVFDHVEYRTPDERMSTLEGTASFWTTNMQVGIQSINVNRPQMSPEIPSHDSVLHASRPSPIQQGKGTATSVRRRVPANNHVIYGPETIDDNGSPHRLRDLKNKGSECQYCQGATGAKIMVNTRVELAALAFPAEAISTTL